MYVCKAGGLDTQGRASPDTSVRVVRRVLLCVVVAELVLVIILLKIVLNYMKKSTAGKSQDGDTDDMKSDSTEISDTTVIRNESCDQNLVNFNDLKGPEQNSTETGRGAKKVRELKQRNRYIHSYRTEELQPRDDMDLTGLCNSRELFGSSDSHVYETLSFRSDVSDSNIKLNSSKKSDLSTKSKKGKRAVKTLPADFIL
ncbi:uncharacterized protein LOC124115156 isoform X2 [Haliotis rufescens]|uniref:uncharacterized protein LOC124115156 isoform X2 n=1 Tax=Haliotis rufescens TaxID=6454 RepID=UPI00201F2198|nr:uncharacterized protein LOC124115156 isoform X2 [Haliotis rufescens]